MKTTDSVYKRYEIAFAKARTHSRRCGKCCVPIVKDAEGNPGLVGEACKKGAQLLREWLAVEEEYFATAQVDPIIR